MVVERGLYLARHLFTLYDMISQQASSRPAEVFLAGQVEDFVFYCEQNIGMLQFQYNYRAYTRYLIL